MRALIGLIAAALAGYFFTTWKMHRDVAAGMDMMVMMMSPYAVVQYEGVSSTLTGELTVDDIRVRIKGFKDEFFIDRLGIDTPSFLSLMKLGDVEGAQSPEDLIPEEFGIIVEGWRLPTDSDLAYWLHKDRLETLGVDTEDKAEQCTAKYNLSPKAAQAMGYENYEMSIAASFQQMGNRYAVEFEFDAEDMYAIDAEMILVGDMLTELAKGSRYRPKMSEMHVNYTDLSLNERMVKYCKLQGLSEEEIRAAQVEAFEFFGRDKGIEFDEYVMGPFNEFLDGGRRSLVFTAKPTEPVTLSQIKLYKPSDVPALLQLTAEVR